MAEYENNNVSGGTSESAANHTSNTAANTGAANPQATQSTSYNDYRSGFYRNVNPHQDEPLRQNSYANTNTGNTMNQNRTTGYAGSGYTNRTGTENGYNYVNYYPNQPQSQAADAPKKDKTKKNKVLKITAIAAACALIVGGAFAGGYFLNGGNNGNRNDVLTPMQMESDNTEKNTDKTEKLQAGTTVANGATPSWLELAARSDAITIPEIVAKMTPSVVGIQATFIGQAQPDFGGFGSYFGFGGQSQTQKAVGTGTGVVMSEDGYIVTNAHVVYDSSNGYGKAASVEVQMSDQETVYEAEIVAYDVESDLAVLKVEQTGLTPAEFGNSDECQVGELVVAIGNPLGLELQNTVTCGIISAMNREITINDKEMTLIQTDTAINSGNSGGPLINSAGQVIGINSAKMSSSYSGTASIEGIGFAIPITEAKEIVDDLITYGYVTGRPQLGITCQDVSEAVSQAYNIPVGAYIISIAEGGAADKAGLQIQDVITAVDGNAITNTEELNEYKNQHDAGEQVILTVVRAGQQMDVPVTLEEVVVTTE